MGTRRGARRGADHVDHHRGQGRRLEGRARRPSSRKSAGRSEFGFTADELKTADRRHDRRPPCCAPSSKIRAPTSRSRTPSSRSSDRNDFVTTPKFTAGRVRLHREDPHAGASERRVPRTVDRQRAAGPRQRQAGHSDARSSPTAFNASRAVAVAAPKESAAQGLRLR